MQKTNALIILAKYPRPGHVKTRLISTIGDVAANRVSELFLVDLLGRFINVSNLQVVIAGALQDTEDEFRDLLTKHHIPSTHIKIFFPRTGSMEKDILMSYLHVLANSKKAILTGSDIPYLSVDMTNKMFATLDKHDLVFHPNTDGGACPHGMKRAIDLFTGTNSRSRNYLQNWLKQITKFKISYQMLMPIFDIDTFDNLTMFYGWQLMIEHSRNLDMFCPETMKFLKSLFGD